MPYFSFFGQMLIASLVVLSLDGMATTTLRENHLIILFLANFIFGPVNFGPVQ